MQGLLRSALFKLTAVYVAIVMTISIGFSVMLYRLTVHELQTGFQNQYTRWLTQYRAYGLRQPGYPAHELATRSHHIYAELIYFNILVLLLTAIASYLLARRTLRPIERAHNQQARFTADVSHELRTPLTALKMDTEVTLLDKKATAEDLRHTLRGNLDEAQRMETLVNNLLQLATLEANQIRTVFIKLNIRDVAANAIKVVSRLAETKHITIDSHLTDGAIMGDTSSLTQLCVILLENAVKYSPEHSAVQLATKVHDGIVSVTISDNGPGIPPSALPHVFDRFYRADTARTTEQKTNGFGLGLSLAKLIADVHGAEIVLSSSVGKGTQATIHLPVARGRRNRPF